MDEDNQRRRSFFFTVRIWPENMGDGQVEWRGKGRYLPSGETCYFRDWSALLAFLEKMVSKDEDGFDRGPDGKGDSP